MPILKKNNKTIYFAHIPKTAGTSVYSLFVELGWKIGNIRRSENPNSSFQKLKSEFGNNIFLDNIHTLNFPHPIQHATYKTWKKWGPFDESFSILRDPIERFKSELKYQYQIKDGNSEIDFKSFVEKKIMLLSVRPWFFYRGSAGHLIPQHYFIGEKTILFDYDGDWLNNLSKRYDLHARTEEIRKNVSNSQLQVEINYTTIKILKLFYYRDYILKNKFII